MNSNYQSTYLASNNLQIPHFEENDYSGSENFNHQQQSIGLLYRTVDQYKQLCCNIWPLKINSIQWRFSFLKSADYFFLKAVNQAQVERQFQVSLQIIVMISFVERNKS